VVIDFNFDFHPKSNLSICISLDCVIVESSLIDSTIEVDYVKYIKVKNILVPVTLNRFLFLDFQDMIWFCCFMGVGF
jgi:hypothetical protein